MTVFQCSRDARDRVKGIPRNAAKARFVDNAIPIGFNFQSISSTPRDTFSNGNAVRNLVSRIAIAWIVKISFCISVSIKTSFGTQA